MQDEFGRGIGTRFMKHFCRGGKWSTRCGWTFCETARTLYTVWALGSVRNLPKQSKSFREIKRRGLLESELINGLAVFKHTVSGVCGVCPILCDAMDCNTPGFPVLHCLPKFAQTHVHWVSDVIQPSHPLSPPFSSCLLSFSASGFFFQWDSSSNQVAKVLEVQHQSFQWIFRTDFL